MIPFKYLLFLGIILINHCKLFAQHNEEITISDSAFNNVINNSKEKINPNNFIDINALPEFFNTEVFIEKDLLFQNTQVEINKATIPDFLNIGFTLQDAERIVTHRETYGKFEHINQIQSIDSIDFVRLYTLIPFLYITKEEESYWQTIQKAKPKAELFNRQKIASDKISSLSSIRFQLNSKSKVQIGFHIRTDYDLPLNDKLKSNSTYRGLIYASFVNKNGKWNFGAYTPTFGLGLNYQYGSGYRLNEGIYGRTLNKPLQILPIKSVNATAYLNGVSFQKTIINKDKLQFTNVGYLGFVRRNDVNNNPFVIDSLSFSLFNARELKAGYLSELNIKNWQIQGTASLQNSIKYGGIVPQLGMAISRKKLNNETNLELKIDKLPQEGLQISCIANRTQVLNRQILLAITAYYYSAEAINIFSNALGYGSSNQNQKGGILLLEKYAPKRWYYYLQGHLSIPIQVSNPLYEPVPNTKFIGLIRRDNFSNAYGLQLRLENRNIINRKEAYTSTNSYWEVFYKRKNYFIQQQLGLQLASNQDSRTFTQNGTLVYYQLFKKAKLNNYSLAGYWQNGGSVRFFQQEFEINSFSRIQQLTGRSYRVAAMCERYLKEKLTGTLKIAYTKSSANYLVEIGTALLY